MATRTMPGLRTPAPFGSEALLGLTDDEVVERLTVKHLARAAYWRLWSRAAHDTAALRRGLRHPDPHVRATCCQILDHFLDDVALVDVVDCLADPVPAVRAKALHTLGCDRCKEGACRPGEDQFIPAALRMLESDPNDHVRVVAAETLGRSSAARRADVATALATARDSDPDRRVRAVARKYA